MLLVSDTKLTIWAQNSWCEIPSQKCQQTCLQLTCIAKVRLQRRFGVVFVVLLTLSMRSGTSGFILKKLKCSYLSPLYRYTAQIGCVLSYGHVCDVVKIASWSLQYEKKMFRKKKEKLWSWISQNLFFMVSKRSPPFVKELPIALEMPNLVLIW